MFYFLSIWAITTNCKHNRSQLFFCINISLQRYCWKQTIYSQESTLHRATHFVIFCNIYQYLLSVYCTCMIQRYFSHMVHIYIYICIYRVFVGHIYFLWNRTVMGPITTFGRRMWPTYQFFVLYDPHLNVLYFQLLKTFPNIYMLQEMYFLYNFSSQLQIDRTFVLMSLSSKSKHLNRFCVCNDSTAVA